MAVHRLITAGSNSKTTVIHIDDTDNTLGEGLTGLVFSDLNWWYYREADGTGSTQVTLATQTLGTWADGGFIEVDATNQPGDYEIGIPDAVIAVGAEFVKMTFKGATNMAQLDVMIQLNVLDLQAAPITLTDIVSDSTAFQGADIAAILADTNELQTDWVDGGRLDLLIDAILVDTGTTLPATLTTIDDFLDTEVAAILAAVDTEVAAILVDTAEIGAAGAGLTAVWTTALTEAYRGTGATGTGAQLLYEILAGISEFAISGTTKTAKKLDGSTTAKTYTLDSATSPTSITEAT